MWTCTVLVISLPCLVCTGAEEGAIRTEGGPTARGAGGWGKREARQEVTEGWWRAPANCVRPRVGWTVQRLGGFGQWFWMSGEMVVSSRPSSGCWEQGHHCRGPLQEDLYCTLKWEGPSRAGCPACQARCTLTYVAGSSQGWGS